MYCLLIPMDWIMTEIPSMRPRMTPPMIAFLKARLAPPLTAKMPPVMNPDTIAFQGSSFCLYHIINQSTLEKQPPHIAKLPIVVYLLREVIMMRNGCLKWFLYSKLPPRKGALFLTCVRPPLIFILLGEFHAPKFSMIRTEILLIFLAFSLCNILYTIHLLYFKKSKLCDFRFRYCVNV